METIEAIVKSLMKWIHKGNKKTTINNVTTESEVEMPYWY